MRPIEKYLWRLGERLRMNEQEIELIKEEMGDYLALLCSKTPLVKSV
ncbi:hypothetical protein [Paenibacillus oleatilyticus]|nr:hypothetical protein [Paenibacillus oleatilyticus]MBU7315209.1 hypothetical protein [Paenibacillus oleatilyticus]